MALVVALCLVSQVPTSVVREPTFERIQLSETFFSEGASFADLDRNGDADVISGPFWYAGPSFTERHVIYAPRAFDPASYSNNFFCFPYDFDGDSWNDLAIASRNIDQPTLDVFKNDALPGPWQHVPGGVPGPVLTFDLPSTAGIRPTYRVRNALPGVIGVAVVGTQRFDRPLLGNFLIPLPEILVSGLETDATGSMVLPDVVSCHLPLGLTFWLQVWLPDPSSPYGWVATNGLSGTVSTGKKTSRP